MAPRYPTRQALEQAMARAHDRLLLKHGARFEELAQVFTQKVRRAAARINCCPMYFALQMVDDAPEQGTLDWALCVVQQLEQQPQPNHIREVSGKEVYPE